MTKFPCSPVTTCDQMSLPPSMWNTRTHGHKKERSSCRIFDQFFIISVFHKVCLKMATLFCVSACLCVCYQHKGFHCKKKNTIMFKIIAYIEVNNWRGRGKWGGLDVPALPLFCDNPHGCEQRMSQSQCSSTLYICSYLTPLFHLDTAFSGSKFHFSPSVFASSLCCSHVYSSTFIAVYI